MQKSLKNVVEATTALSHALVSNRGALHSWLVPVRSIALYSGRRIRMDLVNLATNLLSKINVFTNHSTLTDSKRFELREEIRAEAKKISHAVDGPEQALKSITRGYTTSTALKICIDLNLAQRLSETESRTLEELADRAVCDKLVLRPILRLLAHNGIFQQTNDGKWRHTETSSIMTRPPFRAWMTSILEEKYRAVAHLPRLLKDTGYRLPSPSRTAFNAVYATSLDFYTYSDQFGHEPALNFAVSMEELSRNQLPFLENSYPLDKLEPNTHFVDVAGGFGNLCYFLAERLPEATFVVQDLPFIVEQARQSCPAALKDRISFHSHNMLSPQPNIDRTLGVRLVFLLKIILHDHGDQDCKLILKNLISAMNTGDRILIIDTVIPEIGGSLSSSISDLIILSMFGCGHRTLEEIYALINGCGEDLKIQCFVGGTEEFDGMMVIEIQKSAEEDAQI